MSKTNKKKDKYINSDSESNIMNKSETKKNKEEDTYINSDSEESDIDSDIYNEVIDELDINNKTKKNDDELSDNDLTEISNINNNEDIDSINYLREDTELNDHNFNNNYTIVEKKDRITTPYLTRYEYIRCLSERTKQISLGAKVMIKNANMLQKNKTPKELAQYEIKETKSCPLIIVRVLPNNTEEHWDINELEILF